MRQRRFARVLLAAGLAVGGVMVLSGCLRTTRVSVASDGTQATDRSYNSAISGDGRYITYDSYASNLVAGDTNGIRDVFVWDRADGSTTLVSVASDGTQGNDGSSNSAISDDGRYITYWSYASNLVAGDTNYRADVFVWDRLDGSTTRVSVVSDGTQANGYSYAPAISGDGRYITYYSLASNLVAGDTNGDYDVFVWDRLDGSTTRVSVASDGTQANGYSYIPAISGDGRYITYYSLASNLVAGDTNSDDDVFVWDRLDGSTTRVSVASDGTQANQRSYFPAISGDGRYVTYISYASNLVAGDTDGLSHVFVWDRLDGSTIRVSVASDGTQASGNSSFPAISGDGRYITYWSFAPDLVAGDTNGVPEVFVWDRLNGSTIRVSVASDGTQANDNAYRPAISGDGRYITYHSRASNLVAGDTNAELDVFVWHQHP